MDNQSRIAELEESIETMSFIMGHITSDSTYRDYDRRLREMRKELEELKSAPKVTDLRLIRDVPD